LVFFHATKELGLFLFFEEGNDIFFKKEENQDNYKGQIQQKNQKRRYFFCILRVRYHKSKNYDE